MTKEKFAYFKKRPYITGLFVIALIFLIYLPALDIYPMRDDFEWLNESYGARQDIGVLFETINHFFRPLVKLSFLLNHTFFKTQAPVYNLTTIFIHLLNVYLLYLLIYRLTKKVGLSLLTVLIFGTSPIYSEVTLWSSGRPDSILTIFILSVLLLYQQQQPRHPLLRQAGIILLTLCAVGAKETWMLLPFLALAFLWIALRIPLKDAIKSTLPIFIFLALYIGYFIARPLLTGTASPTGYAGVQVTEMIQKFGFLLFHYIGLGDSFTAAFWQYALILIVSAGIAYWSWRQKNWPALWGLTWMFTCIAISLPIYYAPSRYNYLPLIGFWVMAVAFLWQQIELLMKRFNLKTRVVFPIVGMILLLHVSYQVIMLQWEIRDVRMQGEPHKTLVEMYQSIEKQLPRNEPIVFINTGTRRAVDEAAVSVKGYSKLLFVRKKAIWQLVFLEPLANFAGNPGKEIMKTLPRSQWETVLNGRFTILMFNDNAFYISDSHREKLLNYFRENKKLPDRVEIVRFVPVGEKLSQLPEQR